MSFDNETLELEWVSTDPSFYTLHGVYVSANGQRIYVSGRGDGHIHIFNSNGEYINNIFVGSMSMLGGVCITKELLPAMGDNNNDNIIDVSDIIISVDSILYSLMLSPYQFFSADMNADTIINIIDVIDIVMLIDVILIP